MKKSGWGRTSLRACGSTPKLYYVMGALDLQPILGIIVESLCWVAEEFLWNMSGSRGPMLLSERKRHFGGTDS